MNGIQKTPKDKMISIRVTTETWENIRKFDLNPAFIFNEAVEKLIKVMIRNQKKLTYKKV